MLRSFAVDLENGKALDLSNPQAQGTEACFVINLLQFYFLSVGCGQEFVQIN